MQVCSMAESQVLTKMSYFGTKNKSELNLKITFGLEGFQNRSTVWSMLVVKFYHMAWGAVLAARALFLLPTSASASLGRCWRCCRLPHCIPWRNYVNRLGTWNVRGINDTTKREEVVDIFTKWKFELFALTETKLKRKGEVSWSGVCHICDVFWTNQAQMG